MPGMQRSSNARVCVCLDELSKSAAQVRLPRHTATRRVRLYFGQTEHISALYNCSSRQLFIRFEVSRARVSVVLGRIHIGSIHKQVDLCTRWQRNEMEMS